MKWIKKNEPPKKERWHTWFAWYPVALIIDGVEKNVWLELVERRGELIMEHKLDYWKYEYRTKK